MQYKLLLIGNHFIKYCLPLVLLFSCKTKNNNVIIEKNIMPKIREVIEVEFEQVFDKSEVKGAVLIYDTQKNIYYTNDYQWAKLGKLPASTFKIPNSIIALETKVMEDDSTLIKWDGEKRRYKSWEKDLFFRDAFHTSCVPCYQKLAREIGVDNMKKYLDKFQYGSIKVTSSNIDKFWLQGESKITQFQQISFLKKFYYSELPISKETESIMKRMMVIKDNEDYKLSGKTGWSENRGRNNGWFVGYMETKNNLFFFATNIEPKDKFERYKFLRSRESVTYQVFKKLKCFK